jgi:catechol 2,3-dioxygenase-like lactoylglutathione lyase family enzyme
MYDHVGFKVKDLDARARFYAGRSAVDAFHRAGLSAGGRDNGAPGLRRDYSPTCYAAFLLDPDGNNVEAVCLK